MVPKTELDELFEYQSGTLYGKHVDWRRKESNSRVCGKPIGSGMPQGHLAMNFTDKRGKKHRELVHRVIYMMHHGEVPEMLDHIDMDPTNNKISNLRPATKSLNSQNRGAQSNTKWGLRGIYKDKWGGYYVHIRLNGKRHSLGRTNCIGKAWRMRKDGEDRYWPNARTNESPTQG